MSQVKRGLLNFLCVLSFYNFPNLHQSVCLIESVKALILMVHPIIDYEMKTIILLWTNLGHFNGTQPQYDIIILIAVTYMYDQLIWKMWDV